MQAFWGEFLAQLPEAIRIIVYAHLLLLLAWPVFLALEKWLPVNERTPGANIWFNWKVVFSNMLLTPAFYALAIALSATVARAGGLPILPYPVLGSLVGIPFVDTLLQAAALLLTASFLGDLWYYWWHRMQHTVPALWELHKLHHSDETMNATTIYRSHFFELAGQALVRGFSVGLLVDLSGTESSLVAILAAGLAPPIWDIFIHSNVRADRLRGMLPFYSTPQFHWIHHSKLPEHQDKNFAIWLPLFDVVFGSYHAPQPDEYPPTGLSTGEKIDTLWEAQAGPLAAWLRALRPRPTSAARE